MAAETKKLTWEQQVISKVTQIALARIIQANQIAIQVETTFGQAMRGEVDAMTIRLHQFLAREQFIIEHFQLHMGQVQVDAREARRGKILLLHPTPGTVEIHLTAPQLTQRLREDLRQSLQASADFPTCEVLIETLECTFQDDNTCVVVQLNWPETPPSQQATAIRLKPTIAGHAVFLESWLEPTAENTSPSVMIDTICQSVHNVLNLKDFGNRGTQFVIQSIQMQAGLLILNAEAEIFEFPTK